MCGVRSPERGGRGGTKFQNNNNYLALPVGEAVREGSCICTFLGPGRIVVEVLGDIFDIFFRRRSRNLLSSMLLTKLKLKKFGAK